MNAPLLDTHVWIWWMLGDPALGIAEREALDKLPDTARPILCDISLWEFATLVDLGRLRVDGSVAEWLQVAASARTVRILPISPGIVAEMNCLPTSFHRDPADRLIVAAARFHQLSLATRDQKIIGSGLVNLWQA
jgi:PIN domain nuclease of toxin-antitoxin system